MKYVTMKTIKNVIRKSPHYLSSYQLIHFGEQYLYQCLNKKNDSSNASQSIK